MSVKWDLRALHKDIDNQREYCRNKTLTMKRKTQEWTEKTKLAAATNQTLEHKRELLEKFSISLGDECAVYRSFLDEQKKIKSLLTRIDEEVSKSAQDVGNEVMAKKREALQALKTKVQEIFDRFAQDLSPVAQALDAFIAAARQKEVGWWDYAYQQVCCYFGGGSAPHLNEALSDLDAGRLVTTEALARAERVRSPQKIEKNLSARSIGGC